MVAELLTLKDKVSEWGIGDPPLNEIPDRPTAFTPDSLKTHYEPMEKLIHSLIKDKAEANHKRTGFNTDPHSIIHIIVDPEDESKLYKRQYRIPLALIPLVQKVIDRWAGEHRIEPCTERTVINNPILVAPKKDDQGRLTGIRVCIDPRLVNKYMKNDDKFEIPRISDILTALSGKSIFGEFDLSEAYLQFMLHPDSRKYTSFTWKIGMQFVGCPYGLKPIPNTFQRYMTHKFAHLSNVFPYIDNLLHGARTWNEHLQTILAVIDGCDDVNLRIKPGSIRVCQAMLKVLGHILASWGVGIDPQKRDMVLAWNYPEDCANLRAFFGFAGFLADHVRHFADLRAPFDKLKVQDGKVQWTDLLKQQFDIVKQAIANAPWLQHPHPHKRFVVACDASSIAMGGILYQPDDDAHTLTSHNIVSVFSKKFTDTQQRYPVYKKELCAAVYSCLRFHSFIAMRHFTLITDHHPLKFLQDQRSLSSGFLQWIDILSAYDFTVVHRPGILHVMPDALSRMYSQAHANNEPWGTQTTIRYNEIAQTFTSPSDVLSADSISKERTKCEERYSKLISTRCRQHKLKASVSSLSTNSSNSSLPTSTPNSTSSTHSLPSPSKGGGIQQAQSDMLTDDDIQLTSSAFRIPVITSSDDFHFDVEDDDLLMSEQQAEIEQLMADADFDFESDQQEVSELTHVYEEGIEYGAFPEAQYAYINSIAVSPPDELTLLDLETHCFVHVPQSEVAALNDTLNDQNEYISPSFPPSFTSQLESLTLSSPHVNTVTTHALSQPSPLSQSPSLNTSASSPSNTISSDPLEVVRLLTLDPSSILPSDPPVSPIHSPPLPSSIPLSPQESRTLLAVAQRGMTCPPPHERSELIRTAHLFGHLGTHALTQHLFHKGYWWPGMRADIEEAVSDCNECLKFNVVKTGYHPLHPIRAKLPGDHWLIDIAHLPRSRDNCEHMLVVVDVFTGFVILRALEHTGSDLIARTLFDIMTLLGPPRIIQHDRGANFVSDVVASFTRLLGIEQRVTSPYHPQSDGKVERAIRSIKDIICKMLKGSFQHWPLFLPMVQLSYNARIHQLTGSSPYVLFFGRPLNEFRDYSKEGAPIVDLNAWQTHQQRLLSVIYPAIAQRTAQMDVKTQAHYAKLRGANLIPNLAPGTVVTLKDPHFLKGASRPSHKAKYLGKRYVVEKCTPHGVYVLRDMDGQLLDRRVAIDQLKPIRSWRTSSTHKGDVYEVEKILDHRHNADFNCNQYLIKWKGYTEPTWEFDYNIIERRLIHNYHKHAKHASQPHSS